MIVDRYARKQAGRSSCPETPPLICAVLGALIGLAGCQVHPVQLRGTGRTVTLDTVRRTQQAAGQRLGRVAARLDVEEWRYVRPSGHARVGDDSAASRPAEDASALVTGEPPLRGARVRYVWDIGHRRMARQVQPLDRGEATSGAGSGAFDFEPGILLVERTPDGLERMADLTGNSVCLTTYGPDRPERAYNDWPLRHGLENDLFFGLAEKWGGTFEAVQEEGIDLVRVTWPAMGVEITEWFRPDQAFKLHRKETRDLRRRLLGRITASDYRNINGYPYPFSYEVAGWDEWDPSRLTSMHRFKVHSAEFDAKIGDDEFKLDVPAGAVLTRTEMRKTLLPGQYTTGQMRTHRVESAFRADLETLFRMTDEAQTQPSEEVVRSE